MPSRPILPTSPQLNQAANNHSFCDSESARLRPLFAARDFLQELRIFYWRNAAAHSRLRPLNARLLIRISSLGVVGVLAFFALPAFIPVGKADEPKPPSINAPPAVHLANISTRLAVGKAENVLIGGFIILGTQPKKVIIRALGPLVPVKENLADPTLQLHGPGGVISNDNWRDSQQDALKATTIPPRNDYDAAIVQSLDPGTYTAVLAGKGGTTGVALLEVYDLDRTVDSRLANISTRGRVEQGDNVLIGGTIVLGNGPTTVLFRAIGPSLKGVEGKLLDPTLELYNSSGTQIASNNDWQDSHQKDAIEATTIPPDDPQEAAILHDLHPGDYTAIVRGRNNTTGVALIEAYQLLK